MKRQELNPSNSCAVMSARMRVLHIENTAGVPSIIARAQNASGTYARVLETYHDSHAFEHDYEFYFDHSFRDLSRMRKIVHLAGEFDVLHVHSGINWKRLDIVASKLLKRKPLVVHYHGSESRMGYGMSYRFLADAKLVSTPDLLKWHPDALYLPNPIEFRDLVFDMTAKPRLIHMPTKRNLKGTDTIIAAVKDLRKELDFEFDLVENTPHDEAMGRLRRSHILIDQVVSSGSTSMGIIGMVSFEAMSMGKVAVGYLTPEIRRMHPAELPYVAIDRPDKECLKETLRKLITDLGSSREIGLRSQNYVRKYHDPQAVAATLSTVYEQVVKR